MTVEGQKVQYVGEDTMVGIGTLGKVLAANGTSQHVQWLGGLREGQIDLVAEYDLVPFQTGDPMSVSAQFDASLDVPMSTLGVREVYDDSGEDGLINALGEAGHLATLSGYATEAVGQLATLLRHDPAFGPVLAQLDENEAESLVQRVTASLLAVATTEEE